MNKAKTLRRKLGNPKGFLRVAWDTDNNPNLVSVNPNIVWSGINWKKVEKSVYKLQKLIYRASSRGEISKMRKYQRLLTKSYYARLLAVRCVTQDNQGEKILGVDGIKRLQPMAKFKLVEILKSHSLKGNSIRRVWIPNLGQDEKCLDISTYNRALQALVKLGMEPEWEARFEPNSYGFRPGRSTHDAVEAIYISINHQPKYVLDVYISNKCFDQINHDALLEKVGQSPYRKLVKQWLRSGVFKTNQFQNTAKGTPQAGIINALIANIALHGMEEYLNQFADTWNGKKRNNRCSLALVRYADRFVILHEDIEIVLQAKAAIEEWLTQIGLALKPEKTRIVHTLEEYEGNKSGFDFLGFTIRQWEVKSTGLGIKTLIKPSEKEIKSHYRKLAEICDKMKTAPVRALIAKLNPIIRGWANYYSSVVSKEIFSKLDYLLRKRLWRWASRRHPNKNVRWVKDKYFKSVKSINNRNWIFSDGEYQLNLHSDVSIVRHIKVKGKKLPYDADWLYWESRIGKHPVPKVDVAKSLKSQKQKFAFCGLTFRPTDLMEIEHPLPEV